MTKPSPFQSVHEQLGANFGEYHGWKMPADYGNIDAEREAIAQNCAAFDLCSVGRIQISGTGAIEAIGQTTGIWADALEVYAGTGADFARVYRTGEQEYLLLAWPNRTEEILERLEASEGVKIENLTEKTAMLGIYGPRAVEAIANILPMPVPDLDTGAIKVMNLFMMKIVIFRDSWLESDGMELMCPVGAASLAGGAIAKYHERENIIPGGMECLEWARAQAGAQEDAGSV